MSVNETDLNSFRDFKKYTIERVHVVFAVLYSLLLIVGFTGNCLVITVVRKTKSMHTTTNILLVNLAVSDIVILLWCPRTYSFVFYPIHPSGKTGDYICKMFTGNAIITVAIASSVLTLSVLAIERYHALMKPMRTELRLTIEHVKYVVFFIWIGAISISFPNFSESKYSQRYGRCVCPFSLELASSLRTHVICTVVFWGFVPFVVFAYCYFQIIRGLFLGHTVCAEAPSGNGDDRTKQRLAKLLISVTVAFYVCFIPYCAFFLYIALEHRRKLISNQETLSLLLRVFEFLMYCSSCLNPVLYAFRSSNYRDGFKAVFTKHTAIHSSRFASVHVVRNRDNPESGLDV
ncbi:galanin receptor 2a-like [Montipora foliosa]|uniref:galanin receptor 2a-like n=1 Tax=Montipora foliosa TaxID=591990 RepID=UPI0035F1549F